jgi:hypothetical protein
MAEAVTRREFARLEGCDEKQMRRALVADAEGKLDSAQVASGWRKPRADSKEAPPKAPAAPRAKKGADTEECPQHTQCPHYVRRYHAQGAHALGGVSRRLILESFQEGAGFG